MSESTKDMPKISSGMEAPKALNYIEKLVAELCPGGVEYVELNKLLKYEQPGKYTVSSTNYDLEHSTPISCYSHRSRQKDPRSFFHFAYSL